MWTRFWDMSSGGSTKIEPYDFIFIEAPQKEAEEIFQDRFNRDPYNVTCECCGSDYSISEHSDLEQATGYQRGCGYFLVDAEGNEKTQQDWYALPVERRGELTGRYLERQGSSWRKHTPLEDYMKSKDVMFIHKEDNT